MDDVEGRLDEALEESFPASDPIAVSPEPQPWDHEEFHRFELDVEGEIAYLRYRRVDGVLELVHTEVPDALGGRGYGKTLAQFALEFARSEGLLVRPICPFVRKYIEKNPGFEDLVIE